MGPWNPLDYNQPYEFKRKIPFPPETVLLCDFQKLNHYVWIHEEGTIPILLILSINMTKRKYIF